MSGRLRGWLDGLAAVSMIAASSVLIWYTVVRRPSAETFRIQAPPTYKAGETFASVTGLNFSDSSATVVIWVRSGCHYCTESMDFYKRVTSRPRRARVIVMGQESSELLQKYVESHGVRADAYVSVQPRTVKLSGTPSLLLIGSDARVRKIWNGKLRTPAEEEAVLSLIQ